MKVYGQLEKAQLEVLTADPATGTLGRIYYNSVSGRVRYYGKDAAWVSLGTIAGAGIGNTLIWSNEGPDAALADIENNQSVFKFGLNLNQKVYTTVRVPLSYLAGNPIKAYIGAYSPSTSGTWLLSSTAYLIRATGSSADPFSSTANSFPSTNAAINNADSPGVANTLRIMELNLTSTTGTINAIAVSAGDLIKVVLSRTGGVDAEDTRLLNAPSEMVYQ